MLFSLELLAVKNHLPVHKFAFQEIPLITVKCLYNTLRWYSKGKQYLKSMPLALYVHRRLVSTYFDLIHTTTIWNWLGYAQMIGPCLYFGCGLLSTRVISTLKIRIYWCWTFTRDFEMIGFGQVKTVKILSHCCFWIKCLHDKNSK